MKTSILLTRLRTAIMTSVTLATLIPLAANANCSRVIQVPVSPTGLSVIVNDKSIGGIYPDILRNVATSQGCTFAFTAVPRARQEAMFAAGQADLLIPSKRTPRREEFGTFVPLIVNRPVLISLGTDRPAVKSLQDLIERRDVRVAMVRGYDFGPNYLMLAAELTKQNRLTLEPEPTSIARLLKSGAIDYTIMVPYILFGAIAGDARIDDMGDKLRYEALGELPWGDSGAYISKKLNEKDQAILRNLLETLAKSNAAWKSFQQYYPVEILKDSVRPLDSSSKTQP